MGGKKPVGPSKEAVEAQKTAEERAKTAEDAANAKVSSATSAAVKSRTGRRMLLAPGREDELSKLGSSSQKGF